MKKLIFLIPFLFLTLALSAQIPPPSGDGDDCEVGEFWDGIECCPIGQVCNPTPPGGGDPDPPNNPPTPGNGNPPVDSGFEWCDIFPWWPWC